MISSIFRIIFKRDKLVKHELYPVVFQEEHDSITLNCFQLSHTVRPKIG